MENNELTAVKAAMPSLEGLPQEVIEYVHGLVAENVALKDVVGLTVNNLYASGYEAKQNSMHPWESLIFEGEKAMKTPATDAAIAEIKLKTIRELVSKVSEDLKQKGQSARRIEHLDFTWAYIETARAEIHNANLRAGRKG